MIYIVGDTHCPIDIRKLDNDIVKQACGDKFPDYVIILGDAGFLWSNDPNDEQENYWLTDIAKKPWITLFIDGNHENFTRLNALPKISMFGSYVGQVQDRMYHLKRGEVYTIENKKFFTMGGAMSTDKEYRTPYVTWWPEEVPSYQEYITGMRNVHRHNNTVDYVLSHTAPKSILKQYFKDSDRYKDSTSDMLEAFIELKYSKWFFGHMHEDTHCGDKFICSYDIGHIV